MQNVHFKIQFNKYAYLIIAFTLVFTSCARKRAPQSPDNTESSTLSLSELGSNSPKNVVGSINLSSTPLKPFGNGDESLAINQKTSYFVDIDRSNIPEKVKYMFENLAVTGQPGQSYNFIFLVDDSYLTAYKILQNSSDITDLEADTSIIFETETSKFINGIPLSNSKTGNSGDSMNVPSTSSLSMSQGLILVPMFKYKFLSLGVLGPIKNRNGEDTNKLDVNKTDFNLATHIKLPKGTDTRILAPFLDSNSEFDLHTIFVASRFLPPLLADDYPLSIREKLLPQLAGQVIMTRIDSSGVHFYLYHKNGITKNAPEYTSGQIQPCTEAIVNSSCEMYEVANASGYFVRANMSITRSGSRSEVAKFVPQAPPSEIDILPSRLIKIDITTIKINDHLSEILMKTSLNNKNKETPVEKTPEPTPERSPTPNPIKPSQSENLQKDGESKVKEVGQVKLEKTEPTKTPPPSNEEKIPTPKTEPVQTVIKSNPNNSPEKTITPSTQIETTSPFIDPKITKEIIKELKLDK